MFTHWWWLHWRTLTSTCNHQGQWEVQCLAQRCFYTWAEKVGTELMIFQSKVDHSISAHSCHSWYTIMFPVSLSPSCPEWCESEPNQMKEWMFQAFSCHSNQVPRDHSSQEGPKLNRVRVYFQTNWDPHGQTKVCLLGSGPEFGWAFTLAQIRTPVQRQWTQVQTKRPLLNIWVEVDTLNHVMQSKTQWDVEVKDDELILFFYKNIVTCCKKNHQQ